MVDVLAFVGELQTGGAHSEVHAVHVDHARERLTLGGLRQVRVFVRVQGHLYFNLRPTSFADRLSEAEETWMGTGTFLRDETLECILVRLLDAPHFTPRQVASDLFVCGGHRIRCAQDGAARRRDDLNVSSEQEAIQICTSICDQKRIVNTRGISESSTLTGWQFFLGMTTAALGRDTCRTGRWAPPRSSSCRIQAAT